MAKHTRRPRLTELMPRPQRPDQQPSSRPGSRQLDTEELRQKVYEDINRRLGDNSQAATSNHVSTKGKRAMSKKQSERVRQIESDHEQLVSEGVLPADTDVVAYCVAVDSKTLAEIRAEHAALNDDSVPWDEYLATFLCDLRGETPLFSNGATEPIETVG